MKEKHYWFLGFTAVFAALAGFVFWGTWSTDFAPVMPDCPFMYGPGYAAGTFRSMFESGRFNPIEFYRFLGSPYFWQELQYVLGLYGAALGVAYYCRGRGLSRLAAYGAGLLPAFSGYWCTLFSAGHLGWFLWMSCGVFAFGLADRAVRRGNLRHWLLLGACEAWASGYQTDLWLLFAVFTGAYFIWCCIRERKFPWKGVVLSAAVFFLVGAPYIRSAFVNDLAGRDKQIEEGQTVSPKDAASADEREKRWIFVTNWSLPPAESAEFFIPRLNGDTSCPMTLSLGARYGTGVKPYTGALGRPKDAPAGNYRQHSLYVGFVTCILALLGGLVGLGSLGGFEIKHSNTQTLKHSRSDILFFLIAAILCWLCSMGRYCEPVYRVIFSLPFGDYLRAPVKWHHLTEFSICVLAGYGIENLRGLEVWKVWKVGKFAPWILGAVVLIGAIDLARVDHLYCAPVDLREAKRQNAGLQMTFLRRADFNNPQVAAMVQQKKIVALAQPNPEMYLVGVLNPWGPYKDKPWPPMGLPTWLGLFSALGTLAVAAYAACSLRGDRCVRS
ncbi:MAG: hypothetical protein KBT68_11440 [bacterium]|nr:hypothetical protein [Candidatus Colisoma equi]